MEAIILIGALALSAFWAVAAVWIFFYTGEDYDE